MGSDIFSRPGGLTDGRSCANVLNSQDPNKTQKVYKRLLRGYYEVTTEYL